MRTLIFTCLCFVFSHLSYAQIECLSLVEIKAPEIDETIEIFPLDILVEINGGDFTLSIDGGDNMNSFFISSNESTVLFVTVTENGSGSTCSTVIFVLSDIMTETDFPAALCKPDVVVIQDVDNALTISDIDNGSYDEITPKSELVFSISKDTFPNLKPGDSGFQATETLFFEDSEICEVQTVSLSIWDTDGFGSTCITNVFIEGSTSFCSFNIGNCESDLEFLVGDNLVHVLRGSDFIPEGREYVISIDDGPYYTFNQLSIDDIGTHSYRIRNKNNKFICEGNFQVVLTDNNPPIPVCNDVISINLDITNRITINDVDAGSRDDETGTNNLIRSLTLDSMMTLNPGEVGFVAVDFIEFTTDDVCESKFVILHVWDEKGLENSCLSTIQISTNDSQCNFNENPVSCNPEQTLYVDEDQGISIDAGFFSFAIGSVETFLISVDNGPFLTNVELSLEDIGRHDYTISNIDGSRQCSGFFNLEEICTTDPCPNRMSFESVVVAEGDNICIQAFGSTEISLASIQSGIIWDPNVLRYTGIFETGTLRGITVNDVDVDQGELRFLWIIGFGDDPIEGDFGFDICFEVIGTSSQASTIKFGDLPNFRFEAAGGSGFTFPMILDDGLICVDRCPDGSGVDNGNSCYSFDQGQCATDDFASVIDVNATAVEMANQMKAYLESRSLDVDDVKVVKNYHEATCEACGICPEPHRFFVSLPKTNQDVFDAFDFLNAEMIDCDFFSRADIQTGEIPIFINPSNVKKDDSVIRFTINDQATTIYDNGTYGIPQASIISGTNELSIENSLGNVLNGVSTLDIVMTLQYILGFDSLVPYQMIAADLDKSGDVTLTNDVTKMSNLILGIENDIVGSNWFFIPENKVFDASFSGFGFTNNFSKYQFLDTDINPAVGINVDVYKFGDLNQNFALNRSNEEAMIRFDNINVLKDQEYDVEFTLSSEDNDRFVGAQAAIVFDDVNIQELTHTYGTALNYVVENNVVKFSFASLDEFEEIKFTIRMKSNTKNQLDKLLSMSNSFNTEFITSDLSVFNIEMAIHNTTTPTDEYSISKIEVYPNPANDFVNISIPNIAIGEALKVYNTQGQLEYSEIINKEEIKINTSVFNSKGLKVIYINGIQSQRFLIQ